MAIIKCYDCEKEISDKAPACPHCGAPKEEQPPQAEEAEILESAAAEDKPVINKLAEALTTMGFSLKGAVKLTLVLVFGTVVFAGLGEVFSGSQRDARWAHTPVNVRSGRSTADPIATGLERGERVEVDSLVDGWFRVFRNGQPIGYSASSVLNEGPPSSEASIPEISVLNEGPPSSEASIPEIEDGNAPLTAPSRPTAIFEFVNLDTEKVLDAIYPENFGDVRLRIEVKNTGTCVATLNFEVQLLNDGGFPVTDWFFDAGTMAVGESKTLSDVVKMARAEFDEVTRVQTADSRARCVT